MHVEFSAIEPSARFSFVVCFLFVLLLVRLKKYLYVFDGFIKSSSTSKNEGRLFKQSL